MTSAPIVNLIALSIHSSSEKEAPHHVQICLGIQLFISFSLHFFFFFFLLRDVLTCIILVILCLLQSIFIGHETDM